MTTPGVVSGSPHQAHWLPARSSMSVETAGRALSREPFAQVVVGAGPGEAAVAPGGAVPPDGLESRPHPVEARRHVVTS